MQAVEIGNQIVEQIVEGFAVDVDRRGIEPGELRALGVGRHEVEIPAVVAGAFVAAHEWLRLAGEFDQAGQLRRGDIVEVAVLLMPVATMKPSTSSHVVCGVLRRDAGGECQGVIAHAAPEGVDLSEVGGVSGGNSGGAHGIHEGCRRLAE